MARLSKTTCVISVGYDSVRADPALARWLKSNIKKLALLAGVTDGQINLLLIDDARMIRLHQQHMNLPTTTDVLSFDLRDEPDEPMQADLAICLDEAKRQAERRGHEWKMEVLLYALHGMLHMLGYDDLTPTAYRKMHQREDELLQQAGFPPLFATAMAPGVGGVGEAKKRSTRAAKAK